MSVEVAVLALKIVGTALAAKTAIEGIKEGNLLKAVLGGVGAYMGFTALTATGAASATSTVGTQAAAKGATAGSLVDPVAAAAGNAVTAPGALAAESAANLGADSLFSADKMFSGLKGVDGLSASMSSASNMASAPLSFGAESLSSIAPSASSMAGTGAGYAGDLFSAGNVFGNGLSEVGRSALGEAAKSGGFWDAVGGYASKAGTFLKENPALVQMGGQMMQGSAVQDMREQEMKRLLAEKVRERSSRGASVDPVGLARYVYDYSSRRLVPA